MKKSFLFLFIFIVLSINAPNIFSQQDEKVSLSLSMEEAVIYAMEHNYDLLNADLDNIAAKRKVWETTAGGLPHISGAFEFQHIPGEIPVISFNDTASFPIAVRNSGTYSLTVSQLVFSGEYIVGLMATRTYLHLSRATAEKTELETKETVMSGYLTIQVLKSNLDILDSTIRNLNLTLKETAAMVEQGFMEETDHEQIQVTVNTNLNAMKAIENQLLIANYFFKIQLGLGIEDDVILTEDLDDIMAGLDYEGLLAQEFELGNSIDYELLEIQIDISELNLKREKAAFLPSISAFYMYQDKTQKAVFDFTINHLVGLSLNVPIFSSGERLSKVKQAKIELQKSENTMIQMTDMLIMEAEQARLQYQNAYEKYEIQKKNIELAEKIYERTSIKFREGMASSMDLNQANNQYLNNFSSYTGSISELLNANLRYKKALNNL